MATQTADGYINVGASGEGMWQRLCDTLGYGLPYPEAALPRGVPRLQPRVREIGRAR